MTQPEKTDISREEAKILLKNNMEILKENIKRIMREKKINQRDLAFYANTNENFISYFLRKKSNATIAVIGRLAHALDTDIATLVRR